MKGFEIKGLGEALKRGLRPFNNTINTGGLVECFNLAPTADGLEAHEPLVDLRSSYTFGLYYFLLEIDTDDVAYVDGFAVHSPTPYPA